LLKGEQNGGEANQILRRENAENEGRREETIRGKDVWLTRRE